MYCFYGTGGVKKRDYAKRKLWTKKERDFVCDYFKTSIDNGIGPSYDMCKQAATCSVLQSRNHSQIKDFVVAERKRRLKGIQKAGY